MKLRPMPTHEVAFLLGITPRLLRRWADDGKLKLAPRAKGGHSQGRGRELTWYPAQIQEAMRFAKEKQCSAVHS